MTEDGKIAPANEYHSKFCCYIRTAEFEKQLAADKLAAPAEKGAKKVQQKK